MKKTVRQLFIINMFVPWKIVPKRTVPWRMVSQELFLGEWCPRNCSLENGVPGTVPWRMVSQKLFLGEWCPRNCSLEDGVPGTIVSVCSEQWLDCVFYFGLTTSLARGGPRCVNPGPTH